MHEINTLKILGDVIVELWPLWAFFGLILTIKIVLHFKRRKPSDWWMNDGK